MKELSEKLLVSIVLLSMIVITAISIKVIMGNQVINNQEESQRIIFVDINTIPVQEDNEEVLSDIDVMLTEMGEIESITDKREWFLAYKTIVEKYSYILDPPESIYDYYNEEELELLFRVVQAEIGDEYTFTQKCNVASVIFNRLEHEEFGDTISDVLISDQFATISNGRYKKVEVSEDTILACEYAFMIEDTTDGCLFFDSNSKLNYSYSFSDGAHNFYKLKEDKE